APAGFAFFVNAGRKKSQLPQLADGLIAGIGFEQAGGLLSPGIESYVVKTGHAIVDLGGGRILRSLRGAVECRAIETAALSMYISALRRWWCRRRRCCADRPGGG